MGARSRAVVPSSGSASRNSPAKAVPKVKTFPPPGVADGGEGEWVTDKYCGATSVCIYPLCWPVVCCPVDRRRLYVSSRGVRHFRSGHKVSGTEGWRQPLGLVVGLLATMALVWLQVQRCGIYDVCTDWCKNEAVFTIANNPYDPTSTGLQFITEWGDDVERLHAAIEARGLAATMGGPVLAAAGGRRRLSNHTDEESGGVLAAEGSWEGSWLALDPLLPPAGMATGMGGGGGGAVARPTVSFLLEDVSVERIIDTAANVDIIVIDARFKTPWGPPNEWYASLTAMGWSVTATFAGTIDAVACREIYASYSTGEANVDVGVRANGSASATPLSPAPPPPLRSLELPVRVGDGVGDGGTDWGWRLQCATEDAASAWLAAALRRAEYGFPGPVPNRFPYRKNGLCVFGSFDNGAMQCAGSADV